jgi:hypothetical protein
MALFGITLLLPRLSERMTRPIVALGARLSQTAGDEGKRAAFGSSLVLGVATGLLWAPCAGPILGLLLTGAALNGASLGTSFLLLAYAAGAATSLAVALLVGGKVFTAMKQSLGAGEWIRRGLGIAVLAGGRSGAVYAGCSNATQRCIVGDDRASRSSGTQATRRHVQGTYARAPTLPDLRSDIGCLWRPSWPECRVAARARQDLGRHHRQRYQSRPSIFLRCVLNRGPIE